MTIDRKKLGQKLHDEKKNRIRLITENHYANNQDKQRALQKKNAMALFGALLLQAPAGRTYKVKLQNPKITTPRLYKYLEIANAECGTEASFATYDKGQLIRLNGCVMVEL